MPQIRYTPVAGLFAGVILAVCWTPPVAALGLKLSDAELARASDVIAVARVARVDPAWDTAVDVIYTYITLEVSEVLRGAIPERLIILKQLGGDLDGFRLAIPEQAGFTTGQEVLLFLTVRPRDRTLYTTGLWQGKWTIERDPVDGAHMAVRDAPGMHRAGAAVRQATETRPLEPFLRQIRDSIP